jgi:hypothetical protein
MFAADILRWAIQLAPRSVVQEVKAGGDAIFSAGSQTIIISLGRDNRGSH